jgi:predicted RNA-binding protein with TRAM domain
MAFDRGSRGGRGGRSSGGYRGGRSSYGDRGGFGGGFGDREDLPKPVEVGKEYDVEISEVGSKGDGIARIQNFVVFIAGGKTGEKVRVKITSVMSRFATGEKVGDAKGPIQSEAKAEGADSEDGAAVEGAEETVTDSESEASPENDGEDEGDGDDEGEGDDAEV